MTKLEDRQREIQAANRIRFGPSFARTKRVISERYPVRIDTDGLIGQYITRPDDDDPLVSKVSRRFGLWGRKIYAEFPFVLRDDIRQWCKANSCPVFWRWHDDGTACLLFRNEQNKVLFWLVWAHEINNNHDD